MIYVPFRVLQVCVRHKLKDESRLFWYLLVPYHLYIHSASS